MAMTAQEALESIEKQVDKYSFNGTLHITTDDYGVMKSALEKQIPKKPLTETRNRGINISGEYDIDFNYLCPNCKSVVGDFEAEDHFYDYCPECGQALDWSD